MYLCEEHEYKGKPFIPTLIFLIPSQVALVVKNLSASAKGVRDVGSVPGMTVHSSVLAWRLPWTEELGRL